MHKIFLNIPFYILTRTLKYKKKHQLLNYYEAKSNHDSLCTFKNKK
jgi:hypothetical protein